MRRIVPLSAAGWEAIRFFLLFLVMTAQLNRALSAEMSLFLLWVSSVSLAAAAALVFVLIDADRYALFIPLVALMKVVQVLFGLVLLLQLRGVIPFIVALTQGSSIGGQGGTQLASSLPSLLGIAGLDLLSAFFLILYTARFVDVPSRSQPAEQLPAAEFTDVDEEE